MPVTADRIARLRGFGLSEYAARSYLALLDLGTTEARDVSSLSKVPASKIYHILDQLHEKGLVVVLPEFPRKYAPVPFADYLRRLHDEHEAAALAIEREQDALAEMFAVVGDATGGDRGSVTHLRGRRNVRDRVMEMLAEAKRDVLILPTQQQAVDMRAWREPVAALEARGVQVRVLGQDDPRPIDLPAATFAVVVDGGRVLLGHCVPDDGHPTEGNDTGLDVDQEGIVALLTALLGPRWQPGAARAVPVDARAASTLPPPPQP